METLKTHLHIVFEKLFRYPDITSASNELRSIEEIKEILIDNYVPFEERDDFFTSKKWGLYTPYGFIYEAKFKSSPQIYGFADEIMLEVYKEIEDRQISEAQKTFFSI